MSDFVSRFSLSRASVFGKIALLIVITSVVLSVILTTMSAQVSRGLAKDGLHGFAERASDDLALNVVRAVRFNDVDAIDTTTRSFLEFAGPRIESVLILGADGTERFFSGAEIGEELGLRAFTTETDESRYIDVDSWRFMKAVPLLMGDQKTNVGTLGVVWSAETVLAEVFHKQLVIKVVAIVACLFMLFVSAILIRRFITKPLIDIGNNLGDIVGGNYSQEIEGLERTDELGGFARDILGLQSRLKDSQNLQDAREVEQVEQQRVVAALRAGLKALSQRDLTYKIDVAFNDEYEPLRHDFNKGIGDLRDIVAAVIDNSEGVQGGAEEISAASDNLAHRTETQAATLEQTSATLSQITTSVSEAANTAREVEKIVLETRSQTDESDGIVRDAVDAMSEIEQSSEQISNIISVIDDIAFQTNLLALNAGVEAARAGDAGRGFAVVATEVRSLAQRSADAAKEIKTLINGSAEQVERGVLLVRKAGGALSEVSTQVSHISDLVSGIATSSVEQASGVSEINSGVTQLEMVTQENAAMVEESNAAGHLLKQQSAELAELIGQFRIRGSSEHRPQESRDRSALRFA